MITKYSQLPGVKSFNSLSDAFAHITEELNQFHLKHAKLVTKRAKKVNKIGPNHADNRR